MSHCGETRAIDGRTLKQMLGRSVADFPRHIDAINQMNVFPVPDGDTGANMRHTLDRAWQAIAETDAAAAADIASQFAYGALMGARGNSGTILSQWLQGFADGLQGADSLDSTRLIVACERAADLAYAAVATPVEGTMLTVAREASTALRQRAGPETPLNDALAILLDAAAEALRQTPELLPILRQAGVVDAGGMGLLCFLRGLAADANSPPMPAMNPSATPRQAAHEAAKFGYDVQFLMLGDALDIAAIRQDLGQMGDSLLVVGDERTLKVHIHVANPARPLDYAISSGAMLDDIVVENMDLQRRQFDAARHSSELAVIAVASGSGFSAIFKELGCGAIVDGGQSKNPSVEDFLRQIQQLHAPRSVILPNNSNIIASAQLAARLADAPQVDIVATRSPMQGISAMIAWANARDEGCSPDASIKRMEAARAQARGIEITRATKAAQLPGVSARAGDWLAIVDGEILLSAPCIERALLDCFAAIDGGAYELATLYYGADLPEAEANALIQRLSIAHDDLECELVYGGQALYPLLIGLE